MLSFSPAIPSRSDLDWCWYLRRQGQAGEMLERALHNIGVMDPGGWAEWGNSALSLTGAPVEMAFSAASTDLALITEVSDPADDPSGRLAQVCAVMMEFGGKPPAAALRDVLSAAQGDGELRYGAWLGLCTDGKRIHTTLYVELPAASFDLCDLLRPASIAPLGKLIGPQTRATSLAYCGTTGQITMQYRTTDVQRSVLPALSEPAQVSPDILSMSIDGLTEQAPGGAMPTPSLNFSYTTPRGNEAPQLSLYFSAKELFGTDKKIAQRVLACGGLAMNGYGAMLETLCLAPDGQTYHGTIGLTARQNAAPVLSVRVAAPWGCPPDPA